MDTADDPDGLALTQDRMITRDFKTDENESGLMRVTNMFWQRKLTLKQKILWLFLGNTVYGCAYGYYFSIQTAIAENGASYKDQSLLSVAFYPYSFKFILAPFLDRFYSYKFGRSKTYVLFGSLLNCSIFLVFAAKIQDYIDSNNVLVLMLSMLAVTIVLCMVEIATDCWILTLFTEDERPRATTYESLGQLIGITLSYNIFVPLNDVTWLNDNLFPNDPREEPLVYHYQVCLAISVFYFIQFVILLLFVAEEMPIQSSDAVTFTEVLKVFPRHFTNKYTFRLVCYMFACRILCYMIDQTFDLYLTCFSVQ